MIRYPYFKFYAGVWLLGNISYEKDNIKGVFADVCANFWHRNGVLTIEELRLRIKDQEALDYLIPEYIQIMDGFVRIKFLDKQLQETSFLSKINSENGKKGGRGNKSEIKRSLSDVSNSVSENCEVNSETGEKRSESEIKQYRLDKIRLDKIREEKEKNIKKEISDNFLSPDKSSNLNPISPQAPQPKKIKIDERISKSLKNLDKAGKIELGKIEEMFFPGQGTEQVIREFQIHFSELGYGFKNDNATLGCFIPWTNQLKSKLISSKFDSKIPQKTNLSDKQESEYAKFLNLRHRHGEISNFLCYEAAEEKESFIRALIAKYGLADLIRKIYEYGAQATVGSTTNTISHFKAWEPNLKISEKAWQEIIKNQELEEALKSE